jgi:hypothetical protein
VEALVRTTEEMIDWDAVELLWTEESLTSCNNEASAAWGAVQYIDRPSSKVRIWLSGMAIPACPWVFT